MRGRGFFRTLRAFRACFWLRRNRCFLASNFDGGFVFAEPEEGGLANEIVCGPGGESNLRDEFGAHQDSVSSRVGGCSIEWRGASFEDAELFVQRALCLLGKAGAGAAGVDEFAVAIVAQQERADAICPFRR